MASLVSQVLKNAPANEGDARDAGFIPGLRRSPEEGNDNTPVFLPGKFHGPKSLVGYSAWGGNESDMTEYSMHAHTHTCLCMHTSQKKKNYSGYSKEKIRRKHE